VNDVAVRLQISVCVLHRGQRHILAICYSSNICGIDGKDSLLSNTRTVEI
jgi:hypothetical protein